jgi:8-amino-7-oxononanoate synthase
MVIDFTSSLYLGLRHASDSLRPWTQLTKGAPAVMGESDLARGVESRLASLQGCEQSVLMRSTLHSFWDVVGQLLNTAQMFIVDEHAYPIARWALTQASARGAPVKEFAHLDPQRASEVIRRAEGYKPVVVTDGYCPGCGRPAPLKRYERAAAKSGGTVVVDDTQALGILGSGGSRAGTWGRGGGGTLQRLGATQPGVVVVASLAKAFGAPLAGVSGPKSFIASLRQSRTRVHGSPPTAADLRAADRALDVNAARGNALRSRLMRSVVRFRSGLRDLGFSLSRGVFPLISATHSEISVEELHNILSDRGVATVLNQTCRGPALSFLVTTGHRTEQIDMTVCLIGSVLEAGINGLVRY